MSGTRTEQFEVTVSEGFTARVHHYCAKHNLQIGPWIEKIISEAVEDCYFAERATEVITQSDGTMLSLDALPE